MSNFPSLALLAVFLTAPLCGLARADDAYTLHENLHADQKVSYAVTFDHKTKSTSTTNGVATPTDTDTGISWKVTMTTQEARDGSAVRSQAAFDATSVDTSKSLLGHEVKTTCPYAGKTIGLTRHPDDSITDDFQGNASDDDSGMLDNFITPDQIWYPDQPVAVGDTWDNSAELAKYSSLGPKDQLISKCKLDWVKTIDGKQIAQISNSIATIYHEDGNVEEDMEGTAIQWVDIATGIIIKVDEKETSTYSTPKTEATQVSGGTEFTFHAEVLPAATTQPVIYDGR